MAGTLEIMTMLNPNSLSINTPKNLSKCKPTTEPTPFLSFQNPNRSLTVPKSSSDSSIPSLITGTAMAGTIFSTLAASYPAMAAQQLAETAEGDNRGLALLLPIIPAILWVLYNILGPALNQINRMRSEKGIVIGLGLGGVAASSFFTVPSASANEIALTAEASSHNRGLLLLAIVTPAILWVLYNILQPGLNQINRMRSG